MKKFETFEECESYLRHAPKQQKVLSRVAASLGQQKIKPAMLDPLLSTTTEQGDCNLGLYIKEKTKITITNPFISGEDYQITIDGIKLLLEFSNPDVAIYVKKIDLFVALGLIDQPPMKEGDEHIEPQEKLEPTLI